MMACVEKLPPVHGESEREEGEIVDELDELSDISSEEEFLLRQRLEVLENYNNVLERKKAKGISIGSGKKDRHTDAILCDLSEISATELEEPYIVPRDGKESRHLKSYHKPKRRKVPTTNHLAKRETRKKTHKYKKKIALPESTDESEDEYRNKRRKLENAVAGNKSVNDKTSLKARLTKMLLGSHNQEYDKFSLDPQSDVQNTPFVDNFSLEPIHSPESSNNVENELRNHTNIYESVDLCSDDENKDSKVKDRLEPAPLDNVDTVDSVIKDNVNNETVVIPETQQTRDSDEDLELLREHALKTKASNANSVKLKKTSQDDSAKQNKFLEVLSEEEDSDTTELRLICLKSAMLKKAIEKKQREKLKKRLSQSSNLNDELFNDQIEYMKQMMSDNNTDIESVDMDIGSDVDEKTKEVSNEPVKSIVPEHNTVNEKESNANTLRKHVPKEDEFEEDEDLLRAKLLTSLSKNLPNLVDPNVLNNNTNNPVMKTKDDGTERRPVPEEKRFIINLGNSDSEGEHEATKNLTKMHIKLSEQSDFQQKLDLFLKSTRMEVEKSTLPDVVQQQSVAPSPKTTEKFVPKTVKHLPKSEQIEYKNLVKRMAELEKIKNARQSSINSNKGAVPIKDTLKPRNVAVDIPKVPINNNLEEQIALSRKTIAEESAKMLKLKEDATNLARKYKIAATELRNIATAITFNKKEQRAAQIRLSKIRAQHQFLLNSTTSKHSVSNGNLVSTTRGASKLITTKRPQKENDPDEDVKNQTLAMYPNIRVSVVNDLKEVNVPNPRLSIQVDVTNNKKTVKTNPVTEKKESCAADSDIKSRLKDERNNDLPEPDVNTGKEGSGFPVLPLSTWGSKSKLRNNDDYKSPLQALGTANWEEDPNAVLCPFEVGGNCKDPDCKYLHPKRLPEQ